MSEPTTEAGRALLDALWASESPEPNPRSKARVWWMARQLAEGQWRHLDGEESAFNVSVLDIEAEAVAAERQRIREGIAGLRLDNGYHPQLRKGYERGLAAVLATIEGDKP